MYYSKLFGKTNKSKPADADSANARLLLQGGFVSQMAAGLYTYLPLGLRVLDKIKQIVREEMNAIDGQEISIPMLSPKEPWVATGRWDTIDVLFKLEGAGNKEYALQCTAEDLITPLVKEQTTSYKDFPLTLYQIQDKFRNEPRAKSGLLRGREFSMKDLYSFHLDQEGFAEYYERSKEAYLKVYRRCGLDAMVVKASGGDFTERFSHEFQVATEAGEDTVYVDKQTGEAYNKEIVDEVDLENTEKYTITKAIEVGNIFPLETRFSKAIGLQVQGADGQMKEVIMGSYGIGPSRVMGSIVEIHHDEAGIIWPESVAPFYAHIVPVNWEDESQKSVAEQLYLALQAKGVEVLLDDRVKRPGEKFADADLLGMPYRITVGRRAVEGFVELRPRKTGEIEELTVTEVIARLS
ncbi:TPA: hypothetical protein DEB00_02300 [Candidatus Uhrbacteria bacterium]|nr:hypothetical protein [Candidatus Uhrbacteria bacterium]